MLNKDEKEAKEIIKKFNLENRFRDCGKLNNAIDIVLNLITKLQKENEEKDKQIDLMAEYMEENMDEYQLDEIYSKQYNCNGMERNLVRGKEKEIKDIKQYFEKLAKEKGE